MCIRDSTYRVEEDQAEGYLAPVVTGDAASGFTVTNKVEPGGNPGNPGGGSGGDTPGGGSGAPTKAKATPAQPSGLPDTGDPTSFSAALALAALGVVAAGMGLAARRPRG